MLQPTSMPPSGVLELRITEQALKDIINGNDPEPFDIEGWVIDYKPGVKKKITIRISNLAQPQPNDEASVAPVPIEDGQTFESAEERVMAYSCTLAEIKAVHALRERVWWLFGTIDPLLQNSINLTIYFIPGVIATYSIDPKE